MQNEAPNQLIAGRDPMEDRADHTGVVEVVEVVETVEVVEIVELVIIEEYVKVRREIPHAKAYRIRVDKEHFDMPKAEVTGREILDAAGKRPEQWKLYQHKPGHQPEQVTADQIVDLRAHGVERFTTMARDATEGRGPVEGGSPAEGGTSPEGGTATEAKAPPRRDFRLPAEDEQYLDGRGLDWETLKDGSRG